MSMKLIFENWRRFEETEQLIQEISIMDQEHPFKALYIVGPAGAGKTTVSKFIGKPPGAFIAINTDERVENVFKRFNVPMKFEPSPKHGGTEEDLHTLQQNTRVIMQNASRGHVTNLVMKGAPLFWDTTGQDVAKISNRISNLVEMGYDVAIFQVNVPASVSVERDKARYEDEGGRMVGAKVVTDISDKFQQNVVKDQGYAKTAAGINKAMNASLGIKGGSFVTVLGGAVYPNIFALGDFYDKAKDKDYKEGDVIVSDEAAAEMGNPSWQQAKGILEQAKSDMAAFISEPRQITNPIGQAIYEGMMRLVELTGGEQGQNVAHLWATRGTEFVEDAKIQGAISAMGGNPAGMTKGAIRPEKTPVQPSVRGLAKTFGKEYGVRTSPGEPETK